VEKRRFPVGEKPTLQFLIQQEAIGAVMEIGDIYGPSRVARKKFDVQTRNMHTYTRPVVEAGKLLALMEFAAHF